MKIVTMSHWTWKPSLVVLMDIRWQAPMVYRAFLLSKSPQVHVIMLTVFEDNDSVFEAIRWCIGLSSQRLHMK
jgi:hypothetical protein